MCLDELQEAYSALSERSPVIILGDFNAKIAGPRANVNLDQRASMLGELLSENSLISINMQSFCTGPVNTFYAYTGGPQTPIDHIVVPTELMYIIHSAEVIDDNPLNVSDHHPVVCLLAIDLPSQPAANPPIRRPAWNKALQNSSIKDYTHAVSNSLWGKQLPALDCDREDIEHLTDIITMALTMAASDCLPVRHFRRYLRPYWKEQVKDFHDLMLSYRHKWILDGRPRGMTYTSFRDYKKSKDKFRAAMKEAAALYETEHFNNLDKLYDIDQKTFWALLNNRNKKSHISTISVSGNHTTDSLEICHALADHMKTIFSKGVDDHFDQNFKDHLEGRVAELKHCTSNKIIDVKCLLTSQSEWKKGIIIPIFKGGGKPRTSPDSYRGVTLLPVMSKLFEQVIANRIPQFQDSTDFPDPLQCGFQKSLSSLHASFLLQETVYHYKERNDSLKVVFLDSSKAFDTVWHDGLLWKLKELNIHPGVWRIFCNTYSGMESCVLANNTYSSWFKLDRGVRQGSVLSAKLYLVYINELLTNLSHLKKGAFVLDLHLAAPTQADDISLISPITAHLQSMVTECQNYSAKWQFTFSPSKSNVLVFNPQKNQVQYQTLRKEVT
ncbi:uncharacterized protein LOC124275063 [Haliotis rubra]|uniref:uncharacterized protein LOC124275063 n=1 Tax=Haliotis rubra TaxID=36100 RepID=UPI001EE5B1EE|nr:uncharacterized protein LOC124275063 [Haliotis rubra]